MGFPIPKRFYCNAFLVTTTPLFTDPGDFARAMASQFDAAQWGRDVGQQVLGGGRPKQGRKSRTQPRVTIFLDDRSCRFEANAHTTFVALESAVRSSGAGGKEKRVGARPALRLLTHA